MPTNRRRSMTVPLVILAVMAIVAAWNVPGTSIGLKPLLEQAAARRHRRGSCRRLDLAERDNAAEAQLHISPAIAIKAEWAAFGVALVASCWPRLFYGLRKLDPDDVRRTFSPVYRFLVHKWCFDELYAFLFVRPVLRISGWVAAWTRTCIDWLADNSAKAVEWLSRVDEWIDRLLVDSLINLIARWTYAIGLWLRVFQTGNIRQYVMWLVAGFIGLFVLMSLYWNYAIMNALDIFRPTSSVDVAVERDHISRRRPGR